MGLNELSLCGDEALNKWYNLGSDGKWMLEGIAAMNFKVNGEERRSSYMKTHRGTVSFSEINSFTGWLIGTFSGGPFSHVRASDRYGKIVENNAGGVMDYNSSKYTDKDFVRLTYVTHRFAGGENYGRTFGGVNGMGYTRAGACTGVSHLVNPLYGGGNPNNIIPWAYRKNTWTYTRLEY